jgi:hypothetical protein
MSPFMFVADARFAQLLKPLGAGCIFPNVSGAIEPPPAYHDVGYVNALSDATTPRSAHWTQHASVHPIAAAWECWPPITLRLAAVDDSH